MDEQRSLSVEAATLECKKRNVNTPAVKEALKFLEPHILPEWLIPQFRSHLNRDPELEVDKEGQQQVLRPTFKKGGFYDRSGAKI
jgi:hypothetical protein